MERHISIRNGMIQIGPGLRILRLRKKLDLTANISTVPAVKEEKPSM